jgi:hypothetical protein
MSCFFVLRQNDTNLFFLFVRLISTFETQEKICKLDFPTDLREKASIA